MRSQFILISRIDICPKNWNNRRTVLPHDPERQDVFKFQFKISSKFMNLPVRMINSLYNMLI